MQPFESAGLVRSSMKLWAGKSRRKLIQGRKLRFVVSLAAMSCIHQTEVTRLELRVDVAESKKKCVTDLDCALRGSNEAQIKTQVTTINAGGGQYDQCCNDF